MSLEICRQELIHDRLNRCAKVLNAKISIYERLLHKLLPYQNEAGRQHIQRVIAEARSPQMMETMDLAYTLAQVSTLDEDSLCLESPASTISPLQLRGSESDIQRSITGTASDTITPHIPGPPSPFYQHNYKDQIIINQGANSSAHVYPSPGADLGAYQSYAQYIILPSPSSYMTPTPSAPPSYGSWTTQPMPATHRTQNEDHSQDGSTYFTQ